jgi:ornithine carbamoyltransferase
MSATAVRHFLDLADIPAKDLRAMIETSRAIKAKMARDRKSVDKPLAGKTLAMIFDRPSTRAGP